MHHPRCCSALQTTWPWPRPLDHVTLVTTTLDTHAFQDDDFSVCNIDCPHTLEGAVSKRKAEYLTGRLCAREALRLMTGQPAVPAIGDDRAPVWPGHTVGSITHGAGWAAALVALKRDYAGLGIDVEHRLSDPRAARLTKEVLTPGEQRRNADILATEPGQLLTLTFSLKESLFKALYPIVQRRFYFQDAELVAWTGSGLATLRLLTDLSSEWRNGRELEAQFATFDNRIMSLVAAPAGDS